MVVAMGSPGGGTMRAAVIAVAAVLCGAGGASGALDEELQVRSAVVRFQGNRATLRMEGRVLSTRLDPAFEAGVDALAVEFSGLTVASLPDASANASVTTTASGDLRIRIRKAFAGRGSLDLRLYPPSGWFQVKARGLDGAVVREGGAAANVRVVLGGVVVSAVVPFTEISRRKWTYENEVLPPGGPGGGGGGGGGSPPPGLPPPPPDTTPISITILSQGQGSQYPGSMTSTAWVVCRSQAELAALWAKHAPGATAPTVDFANEVVAGWFGGNPSAFHTVYTSWAERYGGGIRAHLYMHGNQGVTGNGTHSVFRITRSDGPITMKGHATFIGTGE
jgi:hypothetical protein